VCIKIQESPYHYPAVGATLQHVVRDTDDIPTEIPPSKMSVDEAARVLGISTGTVRNRLARGTLESVKENGTVFVLLPVEMSRDVADTPTDIPRDVDDTPFDMSRDTEAVVAAKNETIRALKEQLDRAEERDRENRRIIAGLVQRIPELEPAPEPRESPQTASEEPSGSQGLPGRGAPLLVA
jgi:excisionase family DNA binding protein